MEIIQKNIVFFVSSLERPGGIEKITSLISSELSLRTNLHITLLTLSSGKPFFPLSNSIKIQSLNQHKTLFGYFKNIIGLWKFLHKEKPDYFICVGASLILYVCLPALFIKSKYMLWEHFSTSYSWNKYTTKLSRKLSAMLCDSIIVLNGDDYLFYKQLKSKKVYVIPNPSPINESIVHQYEKVRKHIVLAVGRLVEVKAFDKLLKSWSLIPDKKDWNLYIVGEGAEKDKLKELLNFYNIKDTAFILPATDNVYDYYAQASIYALSSRSECFPMVLLEAESFGLPIISYDCGAGCRELVRDKYNGYLVRLGEVSSYAEKMSDLMLNQNLRQEMGNNSLKHIKRFSLNCVIDKWFSIIER